MGTHIADISVNGEKTELYAPTGGGGTSVTVDSELSTTSENPVQNKVITQALNEKSNLISDAWNASTTYAVGQYCIYNNSLWKCLVQHSGQTPTEGTYWTKVNVANEITSVNNSLPKLFIDTSKMLAGSPANNDNKVNSYTATQDCYFSYTYITNSDNEIYIDDVLIIRASVTRATGSSLYTLNWNGYLKKGQKIRWTYKGGKWSVFALQ